MATDRRRQEGAKGPMFFIIVTNPRSQTLKIPPDFTRRHELNLPNNVFLKVPSGSLWRVELTNSNGVLMLHKGWKEFKDYYSVAPGHILVFKYDGKSQFDVLIFDFTATEIEYPFDANRDRLLEPKIEDVELESESESESEAESDDSVVFLEEFYTSPKGNKSVEIPKPRSTRQETRRKRTKADDLVDNNSKRKSARRFRNCFPRGQKEEGSSSNPTTRNKQSEKVGPKRMNLDQIQSTKEVQSQHVDTSMAYQRAKAFMADNPSQNISFISFMHASYVSPECRLRIPIVMGREILHQKNTDIRLRVSGGKVWHAKCSLDTTNAIIRSGWRSFVQENALKLGDVCVFEVNKNNKLVWNITIFRS